MVLIYEFAANEHPQNVSKLLWQQRISHRIVQASGHDQLWILDPSDSEQALNILQLWQHDPDVTLSESDSPKVKKSRLNSFQDWHKSPMTLALLILTSVVGLVTGLGDYLDTLEWFTISSFDIIGNRIQFDPLSEVLAKGEYWRLITPALIHFGAAHLIFNALWVWEVGRKIERLMGSFVWLIFAVFVMIASNVGQYLINGYPLFGGLSGLVYGLVGFAWVMPVLIHGWPVIISKPLMAFFIVWLLIGYTDVLSVFGLGSVANEAHLLGLVSGLAFAGFYSVIWKLFKKY
ncbi:rhomboid family intramembrane serine protease [Marinomonas gallaica]|uniref:rhomboid family intramembrane serine protease n=1 Tax=Marinomonas gallaica TaxID=1806667 RepID=UPI003CE4AD1B